MPKDFSNVNVNGLIVSRKADEYTIVFKANEGKPSKTGLSFLIASSAGNQTLPDGATLGLNVYEPAPADFKPTPAMLEEQRKRKLASNARK